MKELLETFPEMKDAIHSLKMTDGHFKRLFDEYETVAKELHRALEGAGSISDEHAEELKKKRLSLKDELYNMLQKSGGDKKTGTCGNCGCG